MLLILLSAFLFSADALSASLRAQWAANQERPPETVYLQLSEDVVAAGQTLWFQGILSGTQAQSKVLYVEVLNRRQAVVQGIYPIKEDIAQGQLTMPDTLSGGWYQVRAYTRWMRNFGQAAFWSQPLLVVNPNEDHLSTPHVSEEDTQPQKIPQPPSSSDEVQVTLNKTRYRPREPLSAEIRVADTTNPAWVAVSVRKINALTSYFQRTETTVGSKDQTGAPAGLGEANQSDNSFRYSQEDEGLTVSGRVTGMDKQTADRMVVLSVPGNNPYFEYDFADPEGNFRIPVKETVLGTQAIVLQTADTSLRVQWTLDKKFAPENTYQPEALPVVPTSALEEMRQSYALRSRIRAQYDLFRTPDSVAVQNKTDFRFYGAPNFTIRSDDYIALPNFVELNRELMPGVRLRNTKQGYNLDVFDIPSRTFLDGEPSVFLDGVLIHNLPYLVDFPPSEIALIETVNRRTYYGEYRLDGTVALYTKQGDAYLAALSPSALHEQVTLYTPYQAFSAVDSLPPHEPDFRTLLHWQPAVKLNNEPYILNFSNADELGEFEIVVKGIAEDGRQLYARETYTVSLSEVP